MTTVALLNITPELARELETPAAFERARGVSLGGLAALVADVVRQHEAFRQRTGAPARWGGYLAADPEGRLVVGTCGFKGAPDAAGAVEIAYFTFPPYEGRGYATAMAAALCRTAAASGEVRRVLAHTLPRDSASTRVLTKLGFSRSGTVQDPEDGPVWRWERPLVTDLPA